MYDIFFVYCIVLCDNNKFGSLVTQNMSLVTQNMSKIVIGSENSLSPGLCQAITLTNYMDCMDLAVRCPQKGPWN